MNLCLDVATHAEANAVIDVVTHAVMDVVTHAAATVIHLVTVDVLGIAVEIAEATVLLHV